MTLINKLSDLTTEELHEALASETGTSAASFLRCCKILAEMNSRGETVPQMGKGIYIYYREIADGRVLPEFAQVFMGQYVLPHAKNLTHDQQRSLLKVPEVILVEMDSNGMFTPTVKNLSRMTKRETDLAFGPGGLRDVRSQKRSLKSTPVAKPRRSNSLVIRADTTTGEIIIGQVRITPLMLVDAFKELGYKPPTKAR